MSNATLSSLQSFIALSLQGTALSDPPQLPDNITDHAIAVINGSDAALRDAALVEHISSMHTTFEKKADMLRSFVSTGLPHEAASCAWLDVLAASAMAKDAANYPQLAGLMAGSARITVRQLMKRLGFEAMYLLAITGASPTVVAHMMASYAIGQNYTGFLRVLKYDRTLIERHVRSCITGDVETSARFSKRWASVMEGAQYVAAVSDPATTIATPTKEAQPMTINDSVKPIINAVLQQAGTNYTIDNLVQAMVERDSLTTTLASTMAKHEKETADLMKRLRDAKSAAPVSLTVAADATLSLPAGKFEMVDVGTVFPQLANVKLQVPKWTWDTPHPHVPEVNTGYIFRKEPLLRALCSLAANENFWIQGHTGSGKTTFVEQIAAALEWPILRVALDSSIDRAELVGSWKLIPDGKGGTETKFLPGIIERAIAHNYILLLDEMAAGRPDALYTLQPVLEHKGLLVLEDGARHVPMAGMSRIVATDNTCGNGDPSGLYPACRILSAATLDRFAEFIHVPYLTKEEEDTLLEQNCGIKKGLRAKLAGFATEMRQAFVRNELPVSYSPRRSVAFARAVERYVDSVPNITEVQAVTMALRGKLFEATPPEFQQKLTELAKVSINSAIDPSTAPF
jgi:cobaltochelatase CobS